MGDQVVVDGSMGEGGGQILRTAIAISAIAGRKLKIINIRAKRDPPGLRPQHLTAVRAIARISGGKLRGDSVGSTELEFTPGNIRGGSYVFDVGTAGSISLVLQALLPVMAFADSSVKVVIRGGTDVLRAPTIDYVREVLVRLLDFLGFKVKVSVKRRGHYPKGGGIVEAVVEEPPLGFKGFDFIERGSLLKARIRSHAVRLPAHVAVRQAKSASMYVLRAIGVEPEVEIETYKQGLDPHIGPGSGILAWLEFERTVMGGDSVGAKGKPAEIVGKEAARSLVEDYMTGAALDRYASDMIPLYLALSKGVHTMTGARLTSHAETLIRLLDLILEGFRYEILEGKPNEPFKIRIEGVLGRTL